MNTVGSTCIFNKLLKTNNADMGRYLEGIWGLSFLKIGVTNAVLSACEKTSCSDERFIKNASGCFKSLA